MAANPLGIPPLNAKLRLVDDNGYVMPDAHRSLLQLYNSSPLVPISTAAGATQVFVPYAKQNQNVEFTYVKTSVDANIATLIPINPNDKIYGPNGWGVSAYPLAAAQGSKLKLKSDGGNSWYVVS